MKKVTINLDDSEIKILEKRTKKNLLSIKEQIEDIIRRSCVRGKSTGYKRVKPEDRLIHIFSREKRGGWKRKKNRKSIKK
ncbi:MAG: hypothetical protein ABIH59_01640 [archaeon]